MPNIKTIYFIKKASVVCALIALSGCASGPRSVYASLPLVPVSMEMPNKKVVAKQYWSMLSDNKQTQLVHAQYNISVSETYPSALGLSCRELSIKDKASVIKTRIVCENHFFNEQKKPTKGWFFEKTIVESSRYIEL